LVLFFQKRAAFLKDVTLARTQSADYDDRRDNITEMAAELFARRGFLGTSVADLSAACNISKSLVYHYYPSKEDILYEVMWGHISSLVELTRSLAAVRRPAEETIRLFAFALMEAYNGAQARQKVLLNELDNLPPDKRALIVHAQRQVIDALDTWVVELRPNLRSQRKLRRPLLMLFFGMLNWTHVWYDPKGSVSPKKLAEVAAEMFIRGLP